MHKNVSYPLLLLWLLAFVPVTESLSQCIQLPTDLLRAVEQSTIIVEGRVLSSEPFLNESNGLIYTRHAVGISRLFKGRTRAAELQFITLGGVLPQQALQVSAALELELGATGVFFLSSYSGHTYELHGQLRAALGGASFIQYTPDGSAHGFGRTFPALSTLYGVLEEAVGLTSQKVTDSFLPNTLNRSAMAIESLSPQSVAAGTDDTLFISGSGFGEQPGTVFFTNGANGGTGYVATHDSHILSWSDTLILARLPHLAGSGKLLLLGANGYAFSTQTVDVSFAYRNLLSSGEYHRPVLVDEGADDGGYLFAYGLSTAHSGWSMLELKEAGGVLQSAAHRWRDSMQMPLYMGQHCHTSELQQPGGADDGVNLITFDSEEWSLAEEVNPQALAATFTRYVKCEDSRWEVADIDIVIRRSDAEVAWSFETDGPAAGSYDFESVMMHELGHAMQLQHVVAGTAVMHYALSPGATRRELLPESDLEGALYAMHEGHAYDAAALPCWPAHHYAYERRLGTYQDSLSCGYQPPEEEVGVDPEGNTPAGYPVYGHVRVFPNPLHGGEPATLELRAAADQQAALAWYTSDGRQLSRQSVQLHTGLQQIQLPAPATAAGLYTLLLRYDGRQHALRLMLR